MITYHQYLDRYPVTKDSKTLILGTIHPHRTEEFMIPFFYGNRNSLWNLLSDAFPENLPKPISLQNIVRFLQEKHIAMSDTIISCRRTNRTAFDRDLIPMELNHELVQQIRDAQIDRILCTSSFGKNNAFKLFYENILGLKITTQIKIDREVILPAELFGRPILLKALLSPSGAANISLSKNPIYLAHREKYAGHPTPIYAFKVDYYRAEFDR
ncbi:hypothetical protein M8998_04850 [Sphingobacterium sp. lm-10]|uniref:hypothetical protein n=1 Tax=Sphingobacterium sp. lm-10 TaxID=2944904 RepID=UPI002020F329|nr:hypothetical protein [Sphingobacterium sp. lm-10]MCL7987267.1 hypothetical protein [Sphingobacterium sp. lm-10]